MTDTKLCDSEECGEEFTPRKDSQLYCSTRCRRRQMDKRRRERHQPMEIMVRCHNILCGQWFVGRSVKAKFCSNRCAVQTWDRKQNGNPTASLCNDTIVCSECGKRVKRKTKRSTTCGSKKCLKSYLRKLHKEKRYTPQTPKELEESTPDRSGWRDCLGWCGTKFWSEDKTRVAYCPKCRHRKESKQHEYRFAPAGW